MGRASRWFKALFGIKIKEKDVGDEKAKRTSSRPHNPTTITLAEAAWLRSFYDESDREQSKHAIAVAAATAAAADAAMAAAHAAVRVVRLTNRGGGRGLTTAFGGSREKWAAVKIQTAFRGYLAREALGALKGLVKIQALVRGFLVRKQAAATLQSMQALIRAQASVRAQRIRRNQFQARQSLEKQEDGRTSVHQRRLSSSFEAVEESPKIVEVDTGCRPKMRSNSWMAGEDSILSPCHLSTAQSTPRSEIYLRDPSYMGKTQSFKAKVRSQSAPKQRVEVEKGPKRKLTLLESRNSLSGVRMQTSCSQAINFKNAVMGKLGRSSDFVREAHFYHN